MALSLGEIVLDMYEGCFWAFAWQPQCVLHASSHLLAVRRENQVILGQIGEVAAVVDAHKRSADHCAVALHVPKARARPKALSVAAVHVCPCRWPLHGRCPTGHVGQPSVAISPGFSPVWDGDKANACAHRWRCCSSRAGRYTMRPPGRPGSAPRPGCCRPRRCTRRTATRVRLPLKLLLQNICPALGQGSQESAAWHMWKHAHALALRSCVLHECCCGNP